VGRGPQTLQARKAGLQVLMELGFTQTKASLLGFSDLVRSHVQMCYPKCWD
jgi:hypothetical protein